MAVYGYCRVSTLRQASEGESLDVQRRQIEGYAHMHGMAVEAYLVEEGVSGSVPICERPVGGPLLDALCTGDVLIASKLDRLFRSALDALTMVETLKRRGVRLHLLDLGGDIASSGLSRLFLTIAAAFAEAERDRIRERITQVKAHQKARGRYLGGRPPFGFRIGESGDLERVEEEQRAIVAMRRMRGERVSTRDISAHLRTVGIRISHEGVRRTLSRDDTTRSLSG